MAKLLRVRDRLLLGFALIADVFDEMRLGGGFIPMAYENMYGFVPSQYKRANLYTAVNRMLKADLVERVVERGEPKFRLTSVGRKRFTREFPLAQLQKKAWDKKWRIVIFDIPEKVRWRRDKLRDKLKDLGFGLVQKSAWISPYPFEEDVRQLLEASGLSHYAYLFVTEAAYLGYIEDLVNRAWKIEKLNSAYRALVSQYRESKSSEEGKREFMNGYLNLLFSDPFLPQELLPSPWSGDEARKVFASLAKGR